LLIAFLTCFGIIAAHTMAETARDALFLIHLPASYLPFAYFAIGLSAFVLGMLSEAIVRRFGQRWALVAIIALGAIVAAGFRLAFAPDRGWLFYAFYVWVGTFATTSVVSFWLFVSSIFTVAQGKRLFGPIGAGASLGTFAGAASAMAYARHRPVEGLVLVAAVLLAITAVLPALLSRVPGLRPTHKKPEPALALLGDRYLLHIAALVLLSSLTLMLVDYQFKASAAVAVPPERLAPFIGGVYAILGASSLAVQASAGRFIKRFGITIALSLLPALLVAGGLALPALGMLGRAFALRAADGTLRHSLHRVGMELLYMPLFPETRARIKALLDGTVGRVAQAAASVLLLAMVTMHRADRLLGPAIVIGALAWLALAWQIRQPYVRRFLGVVNPAGLEHPSHFPDLSGASLGVLVAALSDPDPSVVVSALDLLAAQKRERLIPLSILNYRSTSVLVKALDLFTRSGRKDLGPALRPLLQHHEAPVRAAALRAAIALGTSEQLLRRYLDDPSPIIRALVTTQVGDRDGLERMAAGPPEVRAALLEAAVDAELVRRLAESTDPVVLRAACRAIVRLRRVELVPLLISWLGIGAVRPAAREAVSGFGSDALDALERALEDPTTDIPTRRHLPRTLSCIHEPRAAAILTRNLGRHRDGVVSYKILIALGRLASRPPTLTLERAPIVDHAVLTAQRMRQFYVWRTLLQRAHQRDVGLATNTGELLSAILQDKIELGMQRLFRLLALLYPDGGLADLRVAIAAPEVSRRAAALEVLENVLDFELRGWVMPLCDDLPDGERFEAIARRIGSVPTSYRELLEAIASVNETLTMLAAYHASELALSG
jgi:AAA family ATP:ADP antiporter